MLAKLLVPRIRLSTLLSVIVSIIAGIAAVIMMMVGGFMYITSNGDAGKATTGRNTIIYAVVGLLIIALGQAIITLFVNTTPE